MTMERRDDVLRSMQEASSAAERQRLLADCFTRERPRLHSMVELRLDRRVRARVSPSDVLQEAFLEASRRLSSFLRAPRVPLFLWIRRVAADRLHDLHRMHLRAERRDARREVRQAVGGAGPAVTSAVLAERLVKEQASPSDLLLAAERREALNAALEAMAPIDREIITLRSLEMLTAAEAAQVLGIQSAAVRQRYLRALRNLRGILEGRPGGKADR
jgi:RNA polymerase sigma-70 factor (ECF subfamily)